VIEKAEIKESAAQLRTSAQNILSEGNKFNGLRHQQGNANYEESMRCYYRDKGKV